MAKNDTRLTFKTELESAVARSFIHLLEEAANKGANALLEHLQEEGLLGKRLVKFYQNVIFTTIWTESNEKRSVIEFVAQGGEGSVDDWLKALQEQKSLTDKTVNEECK